MLILLPPSETKTTRPRGGAMTVESLSYPELTPFRAEMTDAAIRAASSDEAPRLLDVNPNLADQIARNRDLHSAPAVPVTQLYSGVLYDAYGLGGLPTAALRRAGRWTLVFSPLYGVLRLRDKVAPYRLGVCARLPGPQTAHRYWRERLSPVLDAAAGRRGLIVDARSSSYLPMWTPDPELTDRWVQISVPGASHMAKHTRGLVARQIALEGLDPRTAPELAEALGATFAVTLQSPERTGKPWRLQVNTT